MTQILAMVVVSKDGGEGKKRWNDSFIAGYVAPESCGVEEVTPIPQKGEFDCEAAASLLTDNTLLAANPRTQAGM